MSVLELFSGAAMADAIAATAAVRCSALLSVDFSAVVDAPAQIIEATLAAAKDDMPAFCKVRGYVAPNVGFLLRLPAFKWNGKFHEEGCGGACGVIQEGLLSQEPLRRGYASIVFDGGHTGRGDDTVWAYNNLQGQFDFGIRAPHVVALVGKAITEHYYKTPPSRSYFSGCSTGGQQALSEAQRFPWDFDGIVSGAPSPTFSGPMMNYLWAGRALAGAVHESDLKLVHDRALAMCDMDDGVRDGVIGDPLHCKVDPADLLCKSGQKTQCLTAAQVAAVKKVYFGPTTSTGVKIYSGGPLPGSELNWINDAGYVNGSDVVSPWPSNYFSYIGFMPAPGPKWTISDFDFDRDYKRLRMAESLFGAADNPDLRRFKATGGKLLLYQGGQDESDIPSDAVDYYEMAEKTMGGRAATQDFFRLFLIPGMNHCTTGPGAFAIDYLTYLEAWVEKGQVPDKLIGAHIENITYADADLLTFPLPPTTPVSFTRPIYPYPVRAKYKGSGDPNSAMNFMPVNDP